MDILSYKLGKNASGGGGSLDWTLIGYSTEPQSIADAYNYALDIKQNWVNKSSLSSKFYSDNNIIFFPDVDTSTATKMNSMFYMCYSLRNIPLLNTENVTTMASMFYGCSALKEIPQFDTKRVSNMNGMFDSCSSLKNVPVLKTSFLISNGMNGMFSGCSSLTDTSLNNIMQMCINATGIDESYKSLSTIGISSAQATRCQSLSNYQDLLNAGWTTGY